MANDGGDEGLSIARARLAPGRSTEWHELRGVDERYLVTRGLGIVELDGVLPPTEVAAGDVVRIPAGTPQRITNRGEEDLMFYCLCTPRFRPDAYVPRADLEARDGAPR